MMLTGKVKMSKNYGSGDICHLQMTMRTLREEAREAAMTEFVERSNADPIPPLCDYEPPIHFRWPEYVTTARGRDWWIPSGMDG